LITVIHYLKFIIKLILYLALLPFYLLWILSRILSYKSQLKKGLLEAGVPREAAKELARAGLFFG
jgi:hypothetical protein